MKRRIERLLPYVGPVVAFGAVAASLVFSDPRFIPRIFLADVAVVALAAGFLVVQEDALGEKWAIALPWLTIGALLAAALWGPMSFAPWVALAALAVSFSETRRHSPVRRRLLRRLGLIAGGAAVNSVVLWFVLLGGYGPLEPAAYEAKPLRAHTLLSDVTLHDAWSVQLRGAGTDLTIQEVGNVLGDGLRQAPNAAVAALAGTRALLGWALGWDAKGCVDPAASYVHRLSEEDRDRSVHEPVELGFLYTFERESLLEITNCTVHAFLALSLEPADGGQQIIVGVYVKHNRDITPYYMALIDPFRRLIVYPVIIDHVERQWVRQPT